MVNPINLNKFRKAKARAEQQQQAAENRIKHGRTKAEKIREERERTRTGQTLENSKRDDRD